MPEGFLFAGEWKSAPSAEPKGLIFGFLGCHWGYGRKSLAEWRALLWACGMVRLCDVGVLRKRRFCGSRGIAGLVRG